MVVVYKVKDMNVFVRHLVAIQSNIEFDTILNIKMAQLLQINCGAYIKSANSIKQFVFGNIATLHY